MEDLFVVLSLIKDSTIIVITVTWLTGQELTIELLGMLRQLLLWFSSLPGKIYCNPTFYRHMICQ